MANTHPESTSAMMEMLGRHPLAWKPEDFTSIKNSTPKYVTSLDGAGVAEVESGLDKFKGSWPNLRLFVSSP